MLLLWSGCQQWEDPTADLADRPFHLLDTLKSTHYQLEKLSALSDKEQLDSLLVWIVLLKNYAEEEALIYARQAANLATETNRPNYQAVGHFYMALLEGRQQIYQEGLADPLVNARISERLWAGTENYYWQANVCYLIGELFYRQNKLDSAYQYYQSGLTTLAKLNDQDDNYLSLTGNIYHGLGLLNHYENQLEKTDSLYALAGFYYKKADNREAMATLNQAIADVYTDRGKLDSATYLLQLNVEGATQSGNLYDLSNGYRRLGDLYLKEYRSTADTAFFNLSYELFQKSLAIEKDNYYYTYRRLARLMRSRGVKDVDRAYYYLDSALVYYDKSLVNAREEGALYFFKAVSGNISSLCDWLQANGRNCNGILDTTATYYLHNNYSGVVDTITNDLLEANNNFRNFERQFQTIKNQQRIRNIRYVSFGGLLVATLLFLLLYQRQKTKRLAARMEALRAQINPHFFSNSLNAIESLVNLDQRKAASKYLIHFSRLTRRILNSSLEANTTLAGELETTKHFLMLEQLRFKDKLHFEFDIAADIQPDAVEVPALIFQPYLENSIWHGIKPKTEPSTLLIKVYRRKKELICEIEDDGIGRKAAAKQQANTLLQRKSVGMKITHERLLQFGGGKVEVIDLYDSEGKASGTRVVLRLPYKIK